MFGVLRARKSKARRFYVEPPARLSDVRLLLLLAVIQPQSLPPPASDPAAGEREVTSASWGGELPCFTFLLGCFAAECERTHP